jgi:DNA topoisomerase-6 subunit B
MAEKKTAKKEKLVAETLAEKQRQVSIAEFFERNRHLLGFDNKRKALLTVVKEAVDNALDACEEARILPEVSVEIIDMENDRFKVIIEDNGPGIVRKQVPNIFARLLYGSKFHTMKQARGQQGIGISAAVLYAQMTTGRAVKIKSRIGPKRDAHLFEVRINTVDNEPEILKDEVIEWKKEQGTRIELDIEGSYQKGDQSVDAYIKGTAIVNPHATIIYTTPKAEQFIFARAINKLPKEPTEIKPHPYGVETGMLMKMVQTTDARTMQSFLTNEFSRVGAGTAKEILSKAGISPNTKPKEIQLPHIEKMMNAIKETKIIAPPTDCLAPITSELLEKGLKKEIAAEFYSSVTRSPSVYRGIPFVVEVALAYGGEQKGDSSIKLLRFANRVPLQYQQSSGASAKSVMQTNWKSYGMQQSNGSLPVGVWPPFTSEAKEAVAQYPEIMKEMKLAIQEVGRKLGSYINKKKRVSLERERVNIFERYIPELASSLAELAGASKADIEKSLSGMLAKNKEFISKNKAEVNKVDDSSPESQLKLVSDD